MATLTAEPKVKITEPWMTNDTAESGYDSGRVIHYGDEYDDYDDIDFDDGLGEEPLPKGWEEELANDPEFIAELEQQSARIDAEMAAGTWVGRSTEEVFDRLYKKFPHIFGVKHGQ